MKLLSSYALYYYALVTTSLLCMNNTVYAQNTPKNTAVPVVNLVNKPAAYINTTVNYVRTWEPNMPTADPVAVAAAARTVAEVKQTTIYVDGLGRPWQTVSKGISPAGKDLVAPVYYDSTGREQHKYAPYISPGNNGKFKTNPFGEQATFMGNQYPGQRAYYGETVYENSPLNRVMKTTAPGDNWAGVGRGITQQYLVNTTLDDVRIWNLVGSNIIPTSPGAYPAGQLFKNVTKDERGNRVVEFKDKEGLLILKKVELIGGAGDGHNNWLCTYYVYDNMGMIRCVIPPKIVAHLKSNWNGNFTAEVAKEGCFFYRYDDRNRMVMKLVPGADSVEMVYDVRDRLVFSQDGNLRQQSPKKWRVTFYDGLNRSTMTALYNSTATRESLQTSMNTAIGNTQSISYNVPYVTDLAVTKHESGRTRYEAVKSITFNDGFDSGTNAAFETFLDAAGTQYTISITATNPLPNLQLANLYPLTYIFYDVYGYSGVHPALTTDFGKPEKDGNFYDEAITGASSQTTGLVTGTKARILGTNDWITTTTYYNDKNRVIQTVEDNVMGGKNIVTNLYDFSGKLLSTYQRHQAPSSGLASETPVLTLLSYDASGRLTALKKQLDIVGGARKTISENTYNELGQLKKKRLGILTPTTQLETLTYDYNIRGWMRGINKDYVNNSGTNWYGQELNFDSGFAVIQYNGNIAGTKWKSKSNGIPRAYGFAYDTVNRITKADFSQQNTVNASWTWNHADFSVSGLKYDDNGNIEGMKQRGMESGQIVTLDSLTYTYKANSNKLTRVADGSTVVTKLGDFKNGTNTGDDYAYDFNGNVTVDGNRNIIAITYNHLNLPEKVRVLNKGSIEYLYDAVGNKLRKTVLDSSTSTIKKIVTDYANGFVYQNDTLQFLSHEEGRIRLVYKAGQVPAYWYDYFVKDHLGNIRMVLTEQNDLSLYTATMETAESPRENALFSNIDNSRTAKPVGYPQDQTSPQNEFVAKLNAKDGGKKIGPSLVLRVMAGDTLQIGAKAFYKSQGPQETDKPVPVDDMLASLVQAFGGSASRSNTHSAAGASSTSPFDNNFTSSDYQRLKQKDPDQQRPDKPKAYLNFVLFDDQFNLVAENSGVKQVQGEPDQLQTLAKDKMVVEKTGFLYVYTSNESQQDVFFDNVTVAQIEGPLLEETHYYPFGLVMDGISSNVLKGSNYPENRKKYNGNELQSKEFGEDGLEWYDFNARTYDQQTGRFIQIDPLANEEGQESWSPYHYAINDPIKNNDPDGKIWGNILGGIVGGLTEVASQMITNVLSDKPIGEISWGQVGVAALEGAITSGASVIKNAALKTTITVTTKVVAQAAKSSMEYVNEGNSFSTMQDVVNVAKNTAVDLSVGGAADKAGKVFKNVQRVGLERTANRITPSVRSVVRSLSESGLSNKTKAAIGKAVVTQQKIVGNTIKETPKTIIETLISGSIPPLSDEMKKLPIRRD